MVRRALLLAALALAAVAITAADALAQRRVEAEWIKLAEKRVSGGNVELDVIPVGREKGFFDKLRINVHGSDLFVRDIRIVFGNGEVQHLPMNIRIPNNGASPEIPLQGGIRYIDRIELVYRARFKLSGGRTFVHVFGERLQDLGPARFEAGWELLGRDVVGPGVNREVIQVGRHEGRFEAIRLRVLRNDVAFHDVRVVYASGEEDTLAVRKLIRAGDASPPLELRSRFGSGSGARRIEEIRLVHEGNPNFRGRAVVEVWGLRAPDRGPDRRFGDRERFRDRERERER